MRLFFDRSVRRCVGLASLLFFTVPFGLSVIGCGHKSAPPVFCNSGESGPVVGQAFSIVLGGTTISTVGESLNNGQIGPGMSATTSDCKGNSVSVGHYTFGTSDMTIADVNPSTGSVCAGTWNRQSGSGIPDFTICNPPAASATNHVAFITASAEGVTSNPIAVFVHPTVTAIELAVPQSSSGGCSATDPTSDCCPNVITTTPSPPAPGYDGTSCVSQNDRVQLAAKAFSNGANITCQVGHLSFAAQGTPNVIQSIDGNGFATAGQPGSTTVTASIANSSSASNAGFFSTCPPASIVLTSTGQGTQNPISVSLNTPQPLNATVFDTNIDPSHPNGHQITGLALEFNSTTPQTISAASGSILAAFPGSATITAVCQPGTCNPAPLSQIGYLGNGKPITSNGITANAAGSSGTVLYMASTSSQYVVPYDFTLNSQGSPIKLQFVPNSMVISQDGSTLYFGSPQGMMTISTAGNTASPANQAIPGTVLAVSPDASTVVVTDPTRQTITLVANGTISTTYGNVVGTSAAWSPDSQTVYITTNSPNVLLTYSQFNSWQVTDTKGAVYSDVTVMVPHVGAYFAAGNDAGTDGRTYCSTTSAPVGGGNGNPPTTTNSYYPVADATGVHNQVLAATTDGKHILGADLPSGGSTPVLNDLVLPSPLPQQALDCTTANGPVTFSSSPSSHALSGITASSVDAVVPATSSALAFITYTGSSGLLPEYVPATGQVTNLQLGNGSTAATAPLSGVFSTDNLSFYVGDSDGIVHLLSINGTAATETGVLKPALPNSSGSGNAPVNLIAQHPKRLQS